MGKESYPQVKKINTPRFINIELELDSESNLETDLESNTTTENYYSIDLFFIKNMDQRWYFK